MIERAEYHPDPGALTPRAFGEVLRTVFGQLTDRPRQLRLTVDLTETASVTVDFRDGEPVIRIPGHNAAQLQLGGRWLAVHPVPLVLPNGRRHVLSFTPTTGTRIKVDELRGLRRLFHV